MFSWLVRWEICPASYTCSFHRILRQSPHTRKRKNAGPSHRFLLPKLRAGFHGFTTEEDLFHFLYGQQFGLGLLEVGELLSGLEGAFVAAAFPLGNPGFQRLHIEIE